jgi:branched-chain amino acid transport system substrate-binding protein
MLVARQCREINYNPIAIHGVHGGHYDPEYGQNLQWQAIGTTDTCYFSPFAKIPGLKQLNEKYKKRYGTDIPQNSGNIACGLTLIKDAVERAGSIDIEAMRKAVVATDITRKEYKEREWWWIKAYGCVFNETGQNTRASNVTNVWTSPTSFEQVYPAEFATTIAPWPKMTWQELEKKYASKYPIGK